MKSKHLRTATILAAFLLASTVDAQDEKTSADPEKTWAAFELSELIDQRRRSGRAYFRFLEVPTLSTGIYQLAAGAEDRQQPHDRDEIYFVEKGKARLEVDGEDVAVGPGSIVYVKAKVEHRFHDITEDLTVLVMFAGGTTGSS